MCMREKEREIEKEREYSYRGQRTTLVLSFQIHVDSREWTQNVTFAYQVFCLITFWAGLLFISCFLFFLSFFFFFFTEVQSKWCSFYRNGKLKMCTVLAHFHVLSGYGPVQMHSGSVSWLSANSGHSVKMSIFFGMSNP